MGIRPPAFRPPSPAPAVTACPLLWCFRPCFLRFLLRLCLLITAGWCISTTTQVQCLHPRLVSSLCWSREVRGDTSLSTPVRAQPIQGPSSGIGSPLMTNTYPGIQVSKEHGARMQAPRAPKIELTNGTVPEHKHLSATLMP